MCVIIIKPAGIEMPSYEILKACYESNSHGSGFVSETMHYHSMNFLDFYKHLCKVPKSENCMVHMRYATHGSKKLSNCHPFYNKATDTWFMHNGILDIEPIGDKTDSETAFIKLFVPAIKRYGFDSPELSDRVFDIIGGSKFVFMHDGKFRLYGDFKKIDGVFYSNLIWQRHLRPHYSRHAFDRFAI